jgi:hypothetical protein
MDDGAGLPLLSLRLSDRLIAMRRSRLRSTAHF